MGVVSLPNTPMAIMSVCWKIVVLLRSRSAAHYSGQRIAGELDKVKFLLDAGADVEELEGDSSLRRGG